MRKFIRSTPTGQEEITEAEYRKGLKSTGLGDTIAKATRAVGIKPCAGCKKRQAKLNNLVPYKD